MRFILMENIAFGYNLGYFFMKSGLMRKPVFHAYCGILFWNNSGDWNACDVNHLNGPLSCQNYLAACAGLVQFSIQTGWTRYHAFGCLLASKTAAND